MPPYERARKGLERYRADRRAAYLFAQLPLEEQARQLAEQAIQRAQASLRASRKDPDA